ncbi:MAG TPA: CocE/NonD family hydrolase C-terminal non-catalytic domain-containing protein, partial [Stellaceae bacterium]|nr:CocE/NonD family hydrolase C-terminal non-catalytic domain-containing protein [Stellaceae bacterium]
RAPWLRLLNAIIRLGPLHQKIARPKANPVSMLARALRFPYAPHPWDELYAQIAIEHPLFDEFWRSRDMTDQIGQIAIPLYLGADWENVSVHLLTPFLALDRLKAGTPFRIALAPRGTLQWPWETLHVEALAWFDHWLKHRDTGIMEGPPIRYVVEGTEEWRATDTWPPAGGRFVDLALGADGRLGGNASDGEHDYLYLPANYERPRNTNPPALPDRLAWDSAPAREPVELIGGSVLHLIAASTANDTDWIVKLQDVAPDGSTRDLTQGWLRASHRALDKARSKPHFPYHAHDRIDPLTQGAPTAFEIAILPTAHRFAAGHRLRLVLASEDGGGFAMQGLSHTGLGIAARNRVFARSRLTLPLARGAFG